jgi:hypothetical protein
MSFAMPVIMGVTLASVATGAAVVGAGLTIASQLTGSKLLGKIGMGFSLAGGVVGLGGALTGTLSSTLGSLSGIGAEAGALGSVAGEGLSLAGSVGKLGGSAADAGKALTGVQKTTQAAAKTFDYGTAAAKAGQKVSEAAIKQAAPSFLERMNASVGKYSALMEVAGGVGEAILGGDQFDTQEKMQKRALGQEQREINRKARNLQRGTDIRTVSQPGGITPMPTPGQGAAQQVPGGILRQPQAGVRPPQAVQQGILRR